MKQKEKKNILSAFIRMVQHPAVVVVVTWVVIVVLVQVC
jgi:hypothetical protein